MPTSALILPLDVVEFLQTTQGQSAEKALAYLYMQIHYLRFGPIKATPEAVNAAARTPRIDAQLAKLSVEHDTWRIDAQLEVWRNSTLDAWATKCRNIKESATNAIRARWAKKRASDARTDRINAQSIDTARTDAQISLDNNFAAAKAQERKEHARKAAICRWATYTRERKAKHAHTARIPIEHFSPPSPLSPQTPLLPQPPQGDTFPLEPFGVIPPPPFPGFLVDGQHRFRTKGVQKANTADLDRRLARFLAEEGNHVAASANASARHVRPGNGRFKKQSNPALAKAPAARLKPLIEEICEYWAGMNETTDENGHKKPAPRCPWGPGEDRALENLLRDNPDLDRPLLRRMLLNRAHSEGINPSERPGTWLHDVVRFYAGRLDRFGKRPPLHPGQPRQF